jgi:hypothetical protein
MPVSIYDFTLTVTVSGCDTCPNESVTVSENVKSIVVTVVEFTGAMNVGVAVLSPFRTTEGPEV